MLLSFWLILKFFRWGDSFEWYVKLGSWEELQTRLDRLSSAIVVDVMIANETGNVETLFSPSTIQSPLSSQRQVGGMQGFNPARDSGYYSPRAGTGLGLRADVRGEGSRTPSPKAPVPSVRSDDQRSSMGRPPPDPYALPRRRPVGSPAAIRMPAPQHHQYHQEHQYQPPMAHEEPVMMAEERRPTYGASMLQPGWESAGHVYDPISPPARGINIEHAYDPISPPARGINIEHEYDPMSSPPRGINIEHEYDPMSSRPRGGNTEHGYEPPSSPPEGRFYGR